MIITIHKRQANNLLFNFPDLNKLKIKKIKQTLANSINGYMPTSKDVPTTALTSRIREAKKISNNKII